MMNPSPKRDALVKKQRYVQALTHSRRYLDDEHFLTPTPKN